MLATKVIAGSGMRIAHNKLIHGDLSIIDNKAIESNTGHQKNL